MFLFGDYYVRTDKNAACLLKPSILVLLAASLFLGKNRWGVDYYVLKYSIFI
jgi:hypothetical protein